MGRVVAFEDIQSLPSSEDFTSAKKELLGRLQGLVDAGEIYGVQIFGSAALGKPSLRSDLDIAIVYNTFPDTECLRMFLKRIQGIFTEITETTHVPIQPIILDKTQIEEGRHDISDNLLDHLRLLPNEVNTVGENITQIIKPFGRDRLETLVEYVAHKEYSIHSRATSPKLEDQLEAVKDALEAPANTGRKVLQVFANEPDEQRLFSVDNSYDDGKTSVVRNFMRLTTPTRDRRLTLPQFTGIQTQFEHLLERDYAYTKFLEETRQGLHSRSEYDRFVHQLREDCVPRAIEWLSAIAGYTSLAIRAQREGRIRAEGISHQVNKERH